MRTLILGGGFGGLATATELRRLLPDGRDGQSEHEIVLTDRSDRFLMGFRKLWALTRMEGGLEAGTRSRDALEDRGIRFVRTTIRAIDPAGPRAETDAGTLEADRLVVALGAEPRADLVPGLTEHGVNLYDPEAVRAAAPRVAALDAGRVIVCLAGLPYKCPPAPFEAAMLLDAAFRRRGVRETISITVITLQPALLPAAGPAGHAWLAGELERRGIEFRVGRVLAAVEEDGLRFEDGETLACDLALVIPLHRPPAVVAGSALAGEGGWIRVDPGTLATDHPGVFAIGDCIHIPLGEKAALPKAGVLAEAQGKVVAAAIAAYATGGPAPSPYDGRGACFLETGADEAALVEGDFFTEGGPRVRIAEASPAHAAAKRRFETERLAAWFGR